MNLSDHLRISVVVMAEGLPQEELTACLEHLARLRTPAQEIYVVGTGDETRHTGVLACTGEVIAFLDATSRVEPDWLDELMLAYQDDTVVAVGGRVLYRRDVGEGASPAAIGRLLPNGSITMNFSADPGRPVEVDHLPSANASFRRSALEAIGSAGIQYPGRSHHEVTEMSLRLRAADARLVFQPTALVRAISRDYPASLHPFQYRDRYIHNRDLVTMLITAFGWQNPLARRFAWTMVRRQPDHIRGFVQRLRPSESAAPPQQTARLLKAPAALLWIPVDLSGVAAGFASAAYRRISSAARKHF